MDAISIESKMGEGTKIKMVKKIDYYENKDDDENEE